MIKVRIGGVPEHFNMPWHLAVDEGLFMKQGIDLEFKEYPGGTGAMCTDLREGKLDLAVVLTEGITADIIKGNPSKIVQWFVQSSLCWGIHVSADSQYVSMEELKGKRYAISRFGSGSHLMAHVDASYRNWKLADDQFVLVGNMNGALQALPNGEAEIFLWEKLMTKPYVDKGILRRVGERPTPWPSFAIAATNDFLNQQSEVVKKIITMVSGFESRMRIADIPSLLLVSYGFLQEDVASWLQETKWAENSTIEKGELAMVIESLFNLGIIDTKPDPSALISSLTDLQV